MRPRGRDKKGPAQSKNRLSVFKWRRDLWIGTDQGVARWMNRRSKPKAYRLRDDLDDDGVRAVVENLVTAPPLNHPVHEFPETRAIQLEL